MHVTANGRTPDRAGNELSHCAAGRASRSAVQRKRKVKERRAVQGRGLGNPRGCPGECKGGLRAPAARVRRPGLLGMYVGWIVRRETSTTGKWFPYKPGLRCCVEERERATSPGLTPASVGIGLQKEKPL